MIYAVEALNFIQFLDKKGALYNKTFAKTVRHRATLSAAPRAPPPPRASPAARRAAPALAEVPGRQQRLDGVEGLRLAVTCLWS